MGNIEEQISNRFNGADVKCVIIDEEFGNVTAIVNGVSSIDCGFVEEYQQ